MSPSDPVTLAATRRRTATRAIIKYGVFAFCVVAVVSSLLVYMVHQADVRQADRRERIAENNAVRMELCVELEKLKAQNREDVAQAIKDFPRTLRLLHLENTPEIRRAAKEGWDRKLRRNRAKPCPYRGTE